MKVKKVIFVIISALIFIFMLAVLELNKNTVLGFILAAVAAARLGWRIAVKMPPLPKISRRPRAPKTSKGQEKPVAPDKPENQGKQEKPAKADNPEESGTAAAFAAVRRRVRR